MNCKTLTLLSVEALEAALTPCRQWRSSLIVELDCVHEHGGFGVVHAGWRFGDHEMAWGVRKKDT